jgi:hypothetical protein
MKTVTHHATTLLRIPRTSNTCYRLPFLNKLTDVKMIHFLLFCLRCFDATIRCQEKKEIPDTYQIFIQNGSKRNKKIIHPPK